MLGSADLAVARKDRSQQLLREQVGLTSFVTRICGLTKLLGCKWMNDANFEARLLNGALRRQMIIASMFDRENHVHKFDACNLPVEPEPLQSCHPVLALMSQSVRKST